MISRNIALQALEYGMLLLLFISQVIMNFVVFFSGSDSYFITVSVTNASLILLIIIEFATIALKNEVTHKLKFIFKTQVTYLPNYIMGGFVIYTYT